MTFCWQADSGPSLDAGLPMRRSKKFCQSGPGPTARKQLKQPFLSFLSTTFTVAYQWFISKKSIILQGFGGGGGSNLFQGVKLFPGGGAEAGGPTCDFLGGGVDPLSPLWICACDHLTTRN